MYAETFQELGLSPNEARIYEALLELGKSSVAEIAVKTNIHRRNVYDAVNRLVKKGIITTVIGDKDSHYIPVDPNKLLEVVEEEREKLQKIMPDLEDLFNQKRGDEGMYLLKGVEGYKNYLRDMLHAKGDVYTINAKGMFLDPRLRPFIENFWKEARAKKIAFHGLLDETAKEQVIEVAKKLAADCRIIPKQYSSPMTIDIYDDRVVTVIGEKPGELAEKVTIFMNISQDLADSYRQLFQFMWDHSKELPKTNKTKKRT